MDRINSAQLFQFNQMYCEKIGIGFLRSNSNQPNVNLLNLAIAICSAQFGMALIAFRLYDTKSMGEYGIVLWNRIVFCH